MIAAQDLLITAQHTAPEFGYWEVSEDAWNDGTGQVSYFLSDKYHNEIEVVLTPETPVSKYEDLIWAEMT